MNKAQKENEERIRKYIEKHRSFIEWFKNFKQVRPYKCPIYYEFGNLIFFDEKSAFKYWCDNVYKE